MPPGANARREGGYDSMIDEEDSMYDEEGGYASTVDEEDELDNYTSMGEGEDPGPSSASEEEEEDDVDSYGDSEASW